MNGDNQWLQDEQMYHETIARQPINRLINNLYQNPQNETIPQHHVKLPILVQ
jgi:hypothetical protein